MRFSLVRFLHAIYFPRVPLRIRLAFCAVLAVLTAPAAMAQVAAAPAGTGMAQVTVVTNLEEGHRLFEVHCAVCHGPGGEGGKGPTLAQPTLPRASDDASLIRIISDGIGGTEMPQARIDRKDVPSVAAFVRSLGSRPLEVVPGNPERGAKIYAIKGACAQCHTLRGEGAAIGPDLTTVGRRRSAAYLRRALLDPNADVPQSYSAFRSDVSLPENFLYLRVVTTNQIEIVGVRVNEDTFSIQLRDVTGRVFSFYKDELAEIDKQWGKSPMPSYLGAFTPDELDDLVAFLVSLRDTK